MRRYIVVLSCAFLLLTASAAKATTVAAIAPDRAPVGGRVFSAGTGLADAVVTFAGHTGRIAAPLVLRSDTGIEVVVPDEAQTGAIEVLNAHGAILITLPFTVLPPPEFVRTATLARPQVLRGSSSVAVVLPDGRLAVADRARHQVLVLAPSGAVSLVVGSGKPGDADGSATVAQFKQPAGVAFDAARRVLYVADQGNHTIRQVSLSGAVTTVAGSLRPGWRDGKGADASFKSPAGIAVNSAGTLYVADTGNHVIRAVTAAGVVTTVAGRGVPGYGDGPAHSALFHSPEALAVRGDVVYVADTQNHVIRTLRSNVVTTIAGTTHPGAVDGDAVVAEFHGPAGLAIDDDGTVFVSDTRNHRVRAIRRGDVTTIAGGEKPGFTDTGASPLNALFHSLAGLQMHGALFVADDGNGALRIVYRRLTATAIYPKVAYPSGGQSIRVFGAGFVPGATTVTIGGRPATVTQVAPTELLVTAPPHTAGAAEIVVSTPAGSAAVAGGLTYSLPFIALRILPSGATLNVGDEVQLSAFGVTAQGNEEDVSANVPWTSAAPDIAAITTTGHVTALTSGSATITATYQTLTASIAITVRAPDQVPIDTTIVAPAVPATVVTPFAEVTRFLYEGTRAVQQGVAAGAIDEERVSVLRGHVATRDDVPLAGVRVHVVGHPEYGFTTTRSNGMYDMAVNGGDPLTVRYEKNGYLPVDRQLRAPWHEYAYAARTVMIQLDTAVTAIESNAAAVQVARGNAVSDKDGARRSTLLFPAGTAATMKLPNGSERPLSSLLIRATEYTVEANGPLAMPALLPPQSGYTYCVELSADEAIAAGAVAVRFSKPVISYVENFLGFPVGGIVPSGYYDRESRTWIPSRNGIVLKVLATTGTTVTLDTDGDGAADSEETLALLGINAAERAALASLYSAGQTLWRVPVEHFTPWDYNWPYGPPAGATSPTERMNWKPDTIDKPACRTGSVIECENQVLGETIPITGASASLHYRSSRTAGRTSAFGITVPLTGSTLPPGLRRIELEVTVAGRQFTKTFDAAPSLSYQYTWDGRDIYGRTINGQQRATVKIGYVYGAVYYQPDRLANAFGALGTGSTVSTTADRTEFVISNTSETVLGAWNAKSAALGGWTLTPHHAYDPERRVLYLGDGSQRNTADSVGALVETFATIGQTFAPMVVAGDGSVYVGTASGIRKISRAGVATTLSAVGQIRGIALDAQGRIYASTSDHRIVMVTPTGTVTTVAGMGASGFTGDGGLATQARLNGPRGIAIAGDTIYVADYFNARIRSIGRDGVIRSVAGGGFSTSTFGRATSIKLEGPTAVAVGRDGKLYFSHGFGQTENAGVFRLDANGTMEVAIGGANIQDLAAAPDGGFFFYSFPERRVWHCNEVCRIVISKPNHPNEYGFAEDGDRPENTPVDPGNMAVGPGGVLYYADGSDGSGRIRRVVPALPGGYPGGATVASEDGTELYTFSKDGRHLYTAHATTGATKVSFEYDPRGVLLALEYDAGNRLVIDRDSAGNARGLVAPGGQRTALTFDGDGYLASVANPAREIHGFGYTSAGLLVRYQNPGGGIHLFAYDANGRLKSDADPGTRIQTLTAEETRDDKSVTLSTGGGRSSTYTRREDAAEKVTRSRRDAAGLVTLSTRTPDSTEETILRDGTRITSREVADPRLRTQAPLSSIELRTPAGRRLMMHSASTLQFDPLVPNRIASITTTSAINGKTYSSTHDLPTNTVTSVSPLGRQLVMAFDAHDRETYRAQPGVVPASFGYEKGALAVMVVGDRRYRFVYDALQRLDAVVDPLGRSVGFMYDDADRVVRQTLPDDRTIGFGYDALGHLTSVTPPSRPAHVFSVTTSGLLDSYDAPPVAGEVNRTSYSYDPDGKLMTITRPDLSELAFSYDTAGRLASLSSGVASIGYTWDGAGRLQRLAASSGSVTYAYDGSLPTAMTLTGTVAGTITYGYDNNLLLTSETVNGTAITFGRDADDLLIRAGALTLERDPETGFLTGTTLGSISDLITYTEYGETLSYHASYGATPLYSVSMHRDARGRVTSKSETIVGASTQREYAFDRAGRLTRVTSGGSAVAEYDYDANNNRLAHRWLGGAATATYDAQDRVVTYGDTTFEYTLNGDLKRKVLAGSATLYEYDAVGNLRRVTLPGGVEIEYVIDAQNRRVGKKMNGAMQQAWLYSDQLRIAAELDASGTVVSRFVYGTRSNTPDYMVRGGVAYRVISDPLGSPRLVVRASDGVIMQRVDYDEFGNVLSDTNPGFQPFGFAGGLYDRDTRLVRFGARDYDPHAGRWTTKDPVMFDSSGTNVYEYASSDPINLFDPTGLDPVTADPHNLERMYELWEKAGYGVKDTERAGFITANDNQFACQAWPWSAAYRKEEWPAGKPWPVGTVAVAHTHPNKANHRPSTGDRATADRINLPIYTITRSGIYKYDPVTRATTQEEDSSWAERAKQSKRGHQQAKPRESSCGCPE